MPDFDYSIIDGDSTTRKVRGEDLGLDGDNVQIIGHKLPAVGATDDTPAVDESGSSTAIALLKGILREVANSSGGPSSSYTEGSVSAVSVDTAETTLVTIDCRGKSRVGLTVQNTTATAFNSFQSKIRTNSSFSFHFPEATDTAAYTSGSSDQTGNATALIRKANGDPTNLSNDYRWIRYNVESIESLQITASVASGSTTANVWWVAE